MARVLKLYRVLFERRVERRRCGYVCKTPLLVRSLKTIPVGVDCDREALGSLREMRFLKSHVFKKFNGRRVNTWTRKIGKKSALLGFFVEHSGRKKKNKLFNRKTTVSDSRVKFKVDAMSNRSVRGSSRSSQPEKKLGRTGGWVRIVPPRAHEIPRIRKRPRSGLVYAQNA